MEIYMEEKATELITLFGSKESAKLCVEEILKDLNESLEVSKDLHPQAGGLISGSLVFWQGVKRELCK